MEAATGNACNMDVLAWCGVRGEALPPIVRSVVLCLSAYYTVPWR